MSTNRQRRIRDEVADRVIDELLAEQRGQLSPWERVLLGDPPKAPEPAPAPPRDPVRRRTPSGVPLELPDELPEPPAEEPGRVRRRGSLLGEAFSRRWTEGRP